MTVDRKDLVIIDITDAMNNFATYIAKKREIFEYPRQGYGDYNSRGINSIKAGIYVYWKSYRFGISNLYFNTML